MVCENVTVEPRARLRRETSDAHRAAERSALVVEMMAGRLQRGRYVILLRNLLPVYQLLESAEDPVLPRFPLASIARSDALAHDLAALHGQAWADEVPLLRAGRAYRDRVAELASQAPLLLAAHA
jgi:heme oxygenase (biliverdin-producing, ferredoxin)